MPHVVFTANVKNKFWIGMGREGMIEEWSVRLLAEYVMRYTKYIHLNLKDVKKVMGVVNSLVSPFFTPSWTVCLPFAYYMTERSKIALVGDTIKPVTSPAIISCKA